MELITTVRKFCFSSKDISLFDTACFDHMYTRTSSKNLHC
ncbi:unnamed protein product [Brassica oleracea var. botrytis]